MDWPQRSEAEFHFFWRSIVLDIFLFNCFFLAFINVELKQLELYKNLYSERHRIGSRNKLKNVGTYLVK